MYGHEAHIENFCQLLSGDRALLQDVLEYLFLTPERSRTTIFKTHLSQANNFRYYT